MKLEDLRRNGILLSKEPAYEGELPQHVDRVRASLLDFEGTVGDTIPHNADGLHAADRALIKQYKVICSDAERLHKGKDREAEWQTFFLVNFFLPLVNETRVKDEDTRQTARAKFYYEYFETAQSRPWTLFRQKRRAGGESEEEKGFRQDDRKNLSEPKPDWVAFFPIYDCQSERIPTSERWPLMKNPETARGMIENFSHAALQHLARHGVESNTAGLYRKEEEDWILSDFICFPWLIVEHKRGARSGEATLEQNCYCQAANAGTAAVMMLETLFKIAPGARKRNKTNGHIPPVVTMTTVDKAVRVWITYSCKPSDSDDTKYRMDCIWKGDMTLISDLVKFRIILENTHTWAMREQRPRISTYIDLWRTKHPVERQIEGDPTSGSLVMNAALEAPRSRVPSPRQSSPRSSVVRGQESETSESSSDESLTEEEQTSQNPDTWEEESPPPRDEVTPKAPVTCEEAAPESPETCDKESSSGGEATTVVEPAPESPETCEESPSQVGVTTEEEPTSEGQATPDEESTAPNEIAAEDESSSKEEEATGDEEWSTTDDSASEQSAVSEDPTPEKPPRAHNNTNQDRASPTPKNLLWERTPRPYHKYSGKQKAAKPPDPEASCLDPPMPTTRDTGPPVQTAPSVSSTVPATPNPGGPAPTFSLRPSNPCPATPPSKAAPPAAGPEQQRRREGPIPPQQTASPRRSYFPSDLPILSHNTLFNETKPPTSTKTGGLPTGIRFEFKPVPPPPNSQKGTTSTSTNSTNSTAPEPKTTHSRPCLRNVTLFDFKHGPFAGFAEPSTAKMPVRGLASQTPFTPPASADSTPLKQPPGDFLPAERPRSPSDGRGGFVLRGTRVALPPTPGLTPDGKAGRGRDGPILGGGGGGGGD